MSFIQSTSLLGRSSKQFPENSRKIPEIWLSSQAVLLRLQRRVSFSAVRSNYRKKCYHLVQAKLARKDLRTSYRPRGPQSTSLHYGKTPGFWLSPLSRGRWYNCTSYRSMQCLNASSERNTWRFYSFIGYAEWYPLESPPEVCQSFKEVLSTLRSVGDATGPVLWPQRWVSA